MVNLWDLSLNVVGFIVKTVRRFFYRICRYNYLVGFLVGACAIDEIFVGFAVTHLDFLSDFLDTVDGDCVGLFEDVFECDMNKFIVGTI